LDQSLARYRKAREGLDDLSTGMPGSKLIHPQYLTKLINDHAAQDAVFTFDVGAPAIWGTRLARRSPAAWRSPSSRGPSSRSSGGGHSF
jgi:thiamine pyrophosphate-dependent acetolactate synthase large subunit-like protein